MRSLVTSLCSRHLLVTSLSTITITYTRVGQYTDFLVIPQYHFLISTRILNTEIPYLGIYLYLSDLLCIYIYFNY